MQLNVCMFLRPLKHAEFENKCFFCSGSAGLSFFCFKDVGSELFQNVKFRM